MSLTFINSDSWAKRKHKLTLVIQECLISAVCSQRFFLAMESDVFCGIYNTVILSYCISVSCVEELCRYFSFLWFSWISTECCHFIWYINHVRFYISCYKLLVYIYSFIFLIFCCRFILPSHTNFRNYKLFSDFIGSNLHSKSKMMSTQLAQVSTPQQLLPTKLLNISTNKVLKKISIYGTHHPAKTHLISQPTQNT